MRLWGDGAPIIRSEEAEGVSPGEWAEGRGIMGSYLPNIPSMGGSYPTLPPLSMVSIGGMGPSNDW